MSPRIDPEPPAGRSGSVPPGNSPDPESGANAGNGDSQGDSAGDSNGEPSKDGHMEEASKASAPLSPDAETRTPEEIHLAEALSSPAAREAFEREVRARFLGLAQSGQPLEGTGGPIIPIPPAWPQLPHGLPGENGGNGDSNSNGSEPLTSLDSRLGQVLRSASAVARPGFQAALRGQFLTVGESSLIRRQPAVLARALTFLGSNGGRLGSNGGRRAGASPRSRAGRRAAGALVAVAAGVLLWLARPVLIGSDSSAPERLTPHWTLVQAQGASYGGLPVTAKLEPQPDRDLQVGDEPLRLSLGRAVRVLLTEGSQVALERPCWSGGYCLETALALKAPTEAVVLADATEYPVQVRIETPNASVVLFGADASVKPCGDGTCIVIQSGRALVEPKDGLPRELAAGDRLWVGNDGQIEYQSGYLNDMANPAVQERTQNLKRTRAEVAAGVF